MNAWLWRQQCRLTGETNTVYMTDQEKRYIEAQPGFKGWEPGELYKLDEDADAYIEVT